MTTPLPLDRLCIHQATLMQCGFRESVECLARHGISKTAVWRDKLDEIGTDEGAHILKDQGVSAVSLCPGGLLTDLSDEWSDRNRRWIEQTAQIGAETLVLITGGIAEGERGLSAARHRLLDRLPRLLLEARAHGIRLALEPLHPMVCGYRSILSNLRDALETLEEIDDEALTIAVDAYGLWWDHGLQAQIAEAGERISNFHTSDWLRETRDLRLDRGMPGDGLIDNRQIRGWLEDAGFDGPVEIEIFSETDWWQRDPDTVVRTIIDRLHLL